MANNTQYRVQTLAIKTGRWGGQIVNLEKKAFGWRELGSETGEELTGVDTDTGRIKSRAIKVRYYSRPQPYTHNFLFMLCEALSKILSFIRRIAIALLPLVLIALIVFMSLGEGDFAQNFTIGAVIFYLAAIVGSLLLALLGKILKKALRIEEKLEEDMSDAGYEYE